MTNLKTNLLLAVILLLGIIPAGAQDTTWVQTFNFKDITKRKGEYQFPSKEESYRKILMYYTLKCDAATTADNYPCGEWDYTTYTKIYHKLGIDSAAISHPSFLVDGAEKDEFSFVSFPMHNYFQVKQSGRKVNSVANAKTIELGAGAGENNRFFDAESTTNTSQLLIKASELTAIGLVAGKIEELAFNVAATGTGLNNLEIGIATTSLDKLEKFTTVQFTSVYKQNTTFAVAGWNTITLATPFTWDGTSNLVVNVSVRNYSSGKSTILKADDVSFKSTVSSPINDKYFGTEGKTGKVVAGNIAEMNGVQEFTVENWFRFNDWVAWRNVWGKGTFPGGRIKLCLQTGPAEGQFFAIMRTGVDGMGNDNNHGYTAQKVFKANEWVHVAVVYNGNGASNAERMKIYINGQNLPLTFVQTIPSISDDNANPLIIHNSNDMNFDIDNFRVWSKALNADEVKFSMENSNTLNHPALVTRVVDYSFNQPTGNIIPNLAGDKYFAQLVENGKLFNFTISTLFKEYESSNMRPQLRLLQGDYTTETTETVVIDTVLQTASTVVEFVVGDHAFDISKVYRAWIPGKEHTYDVDNNVSSEKSIEADKALTKTTLATYSKPVKTVDIFEIGRFITPYGINLNLGTNGFTWVYDVTDYEPILHDTVEISAGNNQELIDLKFAFIKGTPARDVIKVEKVWGDLAQIKYAALSADQALASKTLAIESNTKSAMVRARLTGHGHESTDGKYPHCCEWKDNTHYLKANGKLASEWKIWQTYDCGMNPVYPQGGTWPGAREGWCPGDKVKTHDVNLTPFLGESSITLDYDITKVPTNNTGMGNGFYEVSMQMFQYGEAHFANDAELLDLIAPSNVGYHARQNPVCNNARVVLRNGGSEKLLSAEFTYSVSGGKEESYTWTGELDFMESTVVELPISETKFWMGDASNTFHVSVANPSGKEDQNGDNNELTSVYTLPDFYSQDVVFKLRTASMYSEYMGYRIKNQAGEIVKEVKTLANSTNYTDTIKAAEGCYTYEIWDEMVFGLDYWAIQGLTAGSLTIRDTKGTLLKSFKPEFGYKIGYAFAIDKVDFVQDDQLNAKLDVYPNPVNGKAIVSVEQFSNAVNFEVFSTSGEKVYSELIEQGARQKEVDLSALNSGVYFVKACDGEQMKTSKIIVE